MAPEIVDGTPDPEGGLPPLEHKSAAATAVGSGVIPTEDPFEFDIIASVTGVRDLVNDVVVPGAYGASLAQRTPKVIKDHDWKQRLGKVLTVAEYPPGDSHLPRRTPRGAPWPVEAGALMGRVRLFKSEAGRDAAERWREYGPEQEFSVGYTAKRARREAKTDTRYLLEMDLYEISDVLFGAMPLAGTLPAGLATKMLAGAEQDDPDDEAVEGKAAAEPEAEPTLPKITDPKSLRAAVTACEESPTPALKAHIVARAKALNLSFLVPKGWSGAETKQDVPSGMESKAAEASDKPWSSFSEADYTPEQWRRACVLDTGSGDGKGRFKLPVREPSGALNRNGVHAAAAALAGARGGVSATPELKRKAARALVGFYGTLGEDPPESVSALAREGKSSTGVGDVVDGLLDVELESIALGLEGQLGEPDEVEGKWAESLLEGKYDVSPVGHGGDNWVSRAGGLPPFLRAVAHALMRQGKSEGNAIQIAYGRIRRWAAGDGNVTEKTQAKAAGVVSWWEAHTGAGKDAQPEGKALLAEWDPAVEVGPDAGHLAPQAAGRALREIQVEAKSIPYVSGSWEERRELLDGAVRRFLLGDEPEGNGERGKRYVSISATFDDWLVATVYTPGKDGADPESYRIDYELADGLVLLGDPSPAALSVVVSPGDSGDRGDGDYGAAVALGGMESAMAGAKLLAASLEGKAGRVLSGSNMTRIAGAVEALVAVLRSAGVPLDTGGNETGPEKDAESAGMEIKHPGELLAAAVRLRAAAAGVSGH